MTAPTPAPSPLTDDMRSLLDTADVGFLTVVRSDGTPHVSLVYHVRSADSILVSTEASRLKARSIARTGRATYSVHGASKPFPAFSVEGPAVVHTTGIVDATTKLFTKIFGREPGLLTDEGLAEIGRVIIEITPTRAYAVSYL